MNLDTNDATGKLMLQIIGSIAEFERSIMLSRQLEGIARAKAAGKYRGGIPTARAKGEKCWRGSRESDSLAGMSNKPPVNLSAMNRAFFEGLNSGARLELLCRLHAMTVELADRLAKKLLETAVVGQSFRRTPVQRRRRPEG
jgi:hypothetical protein